MIQDGGTNEEGIDLHNHDLRRLFTAICEGVAFRKADSVTPEEKAEVEVMWKAIIGGGYSPTKKNNPKV